MYPNIKEVRYTVKNPIQFQVQLKGFEGGNFCVFATCNQSNANKCLDALKRHSISTQREYVDSPVHNKFIMGGCSL